MQQYPSASASSSRLGPPRARLRNDPPLNTFQSPNGSHMSPSAQKSSAGGGRDEKSRRKERLPWHVVWEERAKAAFRQFGEHCARNQIRVLLIDCFVMTNLFYPALSIYLQKKFPPLHPPSPPAHNTHRYPSSGKVGLLSRSQKEHPLSLLSTPWLDSFFPYPPPLLPRLTWATWWGTDQHEEDSWTGSRISDELHEHEDEIRLMRIGWADVGDVLDRESEDSEHAWAERDFELLNLVRHTAEGWRDENSKYGEDCIRDLAVQHGQVSRSGKCVILGPEGVTPDILPISQLSVHARPSQAATDRMPVNWSPLAGKIYNSIGVLMRVPRGGSDTFEERWGDAIGNLAQGVDGEVFIEPQGPRNLIFDKVGAWQVSLSHSNTTSSQSTDLIDDEPLSNPASNSVPRFILLLYALLVAILGSQVSAASQVHSRYGLAITGIVQVCCSAIMSYSVLALLGLNSGESNLQTYILPFVVVVVGAENMSTLTKAIFSIPFSHSVPTRIGLGLSKVGVSIALTSLTDLAILGIVALCVNLKPVREFCQFAGAVIITDWFMLHTFFLTVLSIDAQRLELADVLANPEGTSPRTRHAIRTGGGRKRASWLRRLTRTRKSKSGSLLIILISIGVIYYITERHRSPQTVAGLYGYTPQDYSSHRAVPFQTDPSSLRLLSASEKLWRSMNPLGLHSIRINIPKASIVVLTRLGHKMQPADIRKLYLPTSRILLPRLKPLFYLFKVVILPQMVTAGTLYALLLYLLKDSEVLDAQRDRLGRGEVLQASESDERDTTPDHHVEVDILPCAHRSDVDLLSTSPEGSVALSVGLDNSIILWRFRKSVQEGTREYLKFEQQDGPIIAVAVDNNHATVATSTGTVQTWKISFDGPTSSIKAQKLDLRSRSILSMEWRKPNGSASFTESDGKQLQMIFSDGSVEHLHLDGSRQETVGPSLSGASQTLVSNTENGNEGYLVRHLSTGLELVNLRDLTVQEIDADLDGTVTAVDVLYPFMAVGYDSGTIEIYNNEGNQMAKVVAPIPRSTTKFKINKIHLAYPVSSRCNTCNYALKGIFLLYSTAQSQLHVHHLGPSGQTSCRCSRQDQTAADQSPKGLAAPPMSSRGASSPGVSPKPGLAMLPPMPNGSLQTPRNKLRSASNTSRLSVPVDERPNGANGRSDLEWEDQYLGMIPVVGGQEAWSISGETVVGLRRFRPGIDEGSWQVWTIDMASPWNGQRLNVETSPFSTLIRPPPPVDDDAAGTSIQEQRNQRLLATYGRLPFPCKDSDERSIPPLAFVEVQACIQRDGGMMLGFGNRIAVISVLRTKDTTQSTANGTRNSPQRSKFEQDLNKKTR